MQNLLIIDDEREILEGLSAVLEAAGRFIITCTDIHAAQLVIERIPVTHVVSDIRLTGPFRFEGLEFVTYVRKHAPGAQVILMTGVHSEGLAEEGKQRGAAAVLSKPFSILALEELLEQQGQQRDPSEGDGGVMHLPMLADVLESPLLDPQFQPIFALSREGMPVIGYESLARYRSDSLFRNPEILFDYAGRAGQTVELELACITRTMRRASRTDRAHKLFINTHPSIYNDERFVPSLTREAERNGIALDRVTLEVTEQGPLGEGAAVDGTLEHLRQAGVTFALDDVGVAHSHLVHIERVRPTYLKISQRLGTDFERYVSRTKIVRNVLSLASDFSCEMILEGIESDRTREVAAELGITLGQGFYLGVPGEAPGRG